MLGCGCGAGGAAGAARARGAGPKRPRQCVRHGPDGLDGRPAGELPRLGVGRVARLVGPDRELRRDLDGVRRDLPDALRVVDPYHPPGGRSMHTRYGFAVTAVLLTLSAGSATGKTREIEYRQGDTVLQGFIAWDDAARGKRPGVLVVHEWWGHNEHARNQARRLAEAGYVGFALDMYGKGKVTTHPQDAQAFASEATKDPAVLAARVQAALEQLKRGPHVDTTRIAPVGDCFGGAVVLGLARARAGPAAGGAVHGAVAPAPAAQPRHRKARILVLAGGADPFVPPEQVEAFKREMQTAGARFDVITYPGAKHGVTNPEAAKDAMSQLAYYAAADPQSWSAMP